MPAPSIEIAVDGSPFGAASSVIMANVGEMAFGAVVAETANPFDGRLDVVAVPPGSRLNLVRLAWRMMTSSLSQARGVRQTLGTHIRLDAEGRVPFQLDGEPAGVLPATVRLERGAVRLFGCRYPKKNGRALRPCREVTCSVQEWCFGYLYAM